jgi:hypothetical protein
MEISLIMRLNAQWSKFTDYVETPETIRSGYSYPHNKIGRFPRGPG